MLLYIFWFLHQTTTLRRMAYSLVCCISFDSYIKPQLVGHKHEAAYVVYLLIPTSNHNYQADGVMMRVVVYLLIPTSNHNYNLANDLERELYIFWFLHQTTTSADINCGFWGCISFDSYIKPQLSQAAGRFTQVVYLLIPTSNHNLYCLLLCLSLLYIFWFLHQTTTEVATWINATGCISFDSYIKPQHELNTTDSHYRCISFDSYIKPQLPDSGYFQGTVVYLLIPTSNHNVSPTRLISNSLYIFWFLHQTTTTPVCGTVRICCISFDSYIKPQPLLLFIMGILVVYLLIPTSNHNVRSLLYVWGLVVYLLIPTSNHNLLSLADCSSRLYIFWFLHQTTTSCRLRWAQGCCISFDSYIKPQLLPLKLQWHKVVYLLIPTSNHNYSLHSHSSRSLYIFWFLHQTTTYITKINKEFLLYIFWFLHQTTTCRPSARCKICCISFDSYIKPQPFQLQPTPLPVVYLLIPTSNHNSGCFPCSWTPVVYLLIPTSNHNSFALCHTTPMVVYLLIPTSNHNYAQQH